MLSSDFLNLVCNLSRFRIHFSRPAVINGLGTLFLLDTFEVLLCLAIVVESSVTSIVAAMLASDSDKFYA